MDGQHQNCEESAFLFGAKKIRCYGSITDLNSPTTSAPKFMRIVVHKVQPNDTLQNLELRYSKNYILKSIKSKFKSKFFSLNF